MKRKDVFGWIAVIALVILWIRGDFGHEFGRAFGFVCAPLAYGIYKIYKTIRKRKEKT